MSNELNPKFLPAFTHIELLAQWQGRFNSQHLINSLGISRSTAGKYINTYLEAHPNSLTYCTRRKSYQPTCQFRPQYSRCLLEDYLTLYGQQNHLVQLSNQHTKPNAQHLRLLITAINNQQRLDVRYASLTNPQGADRILSPHALINDGFRWHVRAWCEKSQAFRDFVLTRIREVYENEGAATHLQEDDLGWNTWVNFSIEPDQRLSPAQRQLVALDYAMQTSPTGKLQKHYSVRGALITYWLQKLRLDTDNYRKRPEAQQIILSPESLKNVQPWLPK